MAEKTPITRQQYNQLRKQGYSDAEIAADDLVLAPTNVTTGQAFTQSASRNDPGRKLAQNIPLVGPWMDEAEGVMQGIGGYAADKLRGKPTSLRGRITGGMEEMDASVRETRRSQGPAGALGDVVLGVAGGSAALKGASRLAKVASGGDIVTPAAGLANYALRNAARVGSGVATGAIMASGSAEMGHKGNAALGGGLVGGGLAMIPAGVEGVQAGKRWADRLALHKGPVNRAHSELLNTMEPDELLNRVAGKPQFPGETVADVAATAPSNYTDQLLRQSVSVPSSRGGQLKREMVEREAGRGGRITGAMEQGTGVRDQINPRQLMSDLRESRSGDVAKAYGVAEAEGAVLDDKELRRALGDTPLGKEARRVAMLRMKNRRMELPTVQRDVSVDVPWHDGGSVQMTGKSDPVSVPNFTLGDYAKRHLDTKIKGLMKQADLGKAAEAVEIRERLVQRMDELVPSYASARLAAREQQSLKEAVRLGQMLGKTPGTDVRGAADLLERLVPQQSDPAIQEQIREAFRKGVASSLQARLAKAKSGTQALSDLVGHENAKDVARLAFPDDASFQQFEQALMGELKQIPGEAMTRGARVDPQFLSTDALGSASPWAVKQALTGEPMLLAAQTAGTLSGQAKKKAGQETAAALTDMARAPVGSKAAQDVARGVRRQRAVPTYQAMQAARQRRKAGEINPMLQRLFQTFVMGAQDR